MTDFEIKQASVKIYCAAVQAATCNNMICDEPRSVTALGDEELIKVVIEVKKVVAADLMMVDNASMMEMMMYCYYILKLNQQDEVLGILMDGCSWHCFNLRIHPETNKMNSHQYKHFSTNEEIKVVGS